MSDSGGLRGEKGHLSWSADWVQRNTKITLNPEQVRCVDVLCTIARPYNLHLINDGWAGILTNEQIHAREADDCDEPPFLAPVEIGPHWLILGFRGDLGTFDGAEMTRLVLAAHEHAVRASVSPAIYRYEDDEGNAGPDACLRLMLHAREREGSACWDWHPTIGQAMATQSGSRPDPVRGPVGSPLGSGPAGEASTSGSMPAPDHLADPSLIGRSVPPGPAAHGRAE